ncbi:MAG TPA: hypothetical protein VLM75_11045 [Spirochaetota bacterium]|nr:hypothetical protein [Spirochaetota bacterium]
MERVPKGFLESLRMSAASRHHILFLSGIVVFLGNTYRKDCRVLIDKKEGLADREAEPGAAFLFLGGVKRFDGAFFPLSRARTYSPIWARLLAKKSK